MADSLLTLVRMHLLPLVDSLGMQVVGDEEANVFDNALVTLQGGDLRLRIVRERSQIFIDFGSTAEPATWFDSAVVLECLGLSETGGWHDVDAPVALRGLGQFLKTFGQELQAIFAKAKYGVTRGELIRIREQQANKRFG